MKKYFLIILSVVCISADAQIVFQKYFSEPFEYQQFARSSIDSSYVMAGGRWDAGTVYDFCAAKVDKNGNILWSKTYPSLNDEYLSSLCVSSSGEIILSGYKSTSAGDNDFSLMKLDAAGSLQWYKSYGNSNFEVSIFSGETASGDIFISGNRDFSQQPMLVKTNNTGSVLWSKNFDTSAGGEEVVSADITAEGGIILSGTAPSQKIFLMKLNADGSTAWVQTYTTTHAQLLATIKQTSDEGFLLSSTDYRCDTSGCYAYFAFARFDSSGNVLFAKAVEGFHGWGRNAAETSDGGFVFTGQLQDTMDNDAVLIKTDAAGNLLWAKGYGSIGAGETFFVEETADGGFALFGLENSQALFIKTDANGNSGCNEKNITPLFSDMNFTGPAPMSFTGAADADTASAVLCTESVLTIIDSTICTSVGINEVVNHVTCIIYPNPSNGLFTIYGMQSPVELLVYDLLGQRIFSGQVTSKQETVLLRGANNGIYFYSISTESGTVSGKLVIER